LCRENVQEIRLAERLKVSFSRFFYEIRCDELHGKTECEFLADADFVGEEASATAALLRN
jgi:hypothetical protein